MHFETINHEVSINFDISRIQVPLFIYSNEIFKETEKVSNLFSLEIDLYTFRLLI